ncbi:MAG: Rieske 2Fe-2S domain-containing protein [Caldilineaceae bacterium SB0666_bin_21]|nr:Rieske 2Fe-2S domain-containing protein [Caldilineaceae bacterium SB0666_bin_21]
MRKNMTLQTPSINRREFLVYSWAASVVVVTSQIAIANGLLMYPRFRAGEFGGEFHWGSLSALPSPDAPPQSNPIGKFWLVNTAEGPRALYMVCPHLGCLYKWVAANNRFECPCHASQFTREGMLIRGPAPRGLDQFAVEVTDGTEVVVQTGRRIKGLPRS